MNSTADTVRFARLRMGCSSRESSSNSPKRSLLSSVSRIVGIASEFTGRVRCRPKSIAVDGLRRSDLEQTSWQAHGVVSKHSL